MPKTLANLKAERSPEALSRKLLAYLKRHAGQRIPLDDIATGVGITRTQAMKAAGVLIEQGANLDLSTGGVELLRDVRPAARAVIDVSRLKGRQHVFGVTADNHLASKYERLDVLNALFDLWHDRGITTVLQLGNIIDGECRFNRHDLHAHGMDNQVNYLIEHWPSRKGMETQYITGDDHEGWYVQREGVDIGMHMERTARAAGRTDLVYLGHMEKMIELKGSKTSTLIHLIHAGGGTAYAISYTTQKMAECVPLDTEILTSHGWRTHDQVRPGDTVLGYNVHTDRCEWTTVEAVHSGTNERVLRYHNDQFDVRCTENHRWAIEWESRGGPNPQSVEPKQYSRSERLLVAIGGTKERSRIIQAARAPDGPGLQPFHHTDWLHRSDVASERVLAMTSGERRAFIEGMMLGEGTIAGRDGNRTLVFSQRPGPVNDAFRLACFLEGIATTCRPSSAGSFRPNGPPTRRVTMLRKRARNVSSLSVEECGAQPVWCVTTGLGTWVLKQGDLISITGNSYQGGEKPSVLLAGHFHKWDYSYPREIHAIQPGCTEDQTPFMRKKRIQAMVGGATLRLDVTPEGLLTELTATWHPFYDRSFYKGTNWRYRWGR